MATPFPGTGIGRHIWTEKEDTVSEELSERKLRDCQERLGYRFKNPELLQAALTHASHSEDRLSSNERLEFLGDAVLAAVVCELLYREYPELLEGDLTRIKSAVVSRRCCARVAERLGLQKYVLLGRGVPHDSSLPRSVLADALESIIAAIFLDRGYQSARKFVRRQFREEIRRLARSGSDENYKSMLQHYAQKHLGHPPAYVVLEEKGPDHSKSFLIAVRLGERQYEPAWGRTKKDAEQKAARNALAAVGALEPQPTKVPS